MKELFATFFLLVIVLAVPIYGQTTNNASLPIPPASSDNASASTTPTPPPTHFDKIITTFGKEYDDVSVKSIEPDGIRCSYSTGIGKISFSDLPADIQKQFNYDRNTAKQYQAEEDKSLAQKDAYYQQVQSSSSLQNAAQRAAALKAAQNRLSQLKANMDDADDALLKATSHVNQYGVRISNNSSHDRDGGAERTASVQVLQSNYTDAKNAYNEELKVVVSLQN